MFDERTNLSQQVKNELTNYFGDKLCSTTVPRNIRLAEAPSHGKAALMYDPRSKGAESYIRLAKEIIERQAAGFGMPVSETEPASEQELTTEVTEEHREERVQTDAGVVVTAEDLATESPSTSLETSTGDHGGEAAVKEMPTTAAEMDKSA
jgi:hypothetical protein